MYGNTIGRIYNKKESPETFTIIEAIEMNQKLVKDLEILMSEIPNTQKKIKELAKKLKKKLEYL